MFELSVSHRDLTGFEAAIRSACALQSETPLSGDVPAFAESSIVSSCRYTLGPPRVRWSPRVTGAGIPFSTTVAGTIRVRIAGIFP